MTINEVAKKLLELREQRMTGFIMSGVLREELGFEGYGEALRRRWIEADLEQSGMVTVTNNLNTVAEIRSLAAEAKTCTCKGGKEGECKCGCKEGKCTCESQQESLSETAHFFAQAHAFRRNAVRSVGESDVPGEELPTFSDAEHEEFYQQRVSPLRSHYMKNYAGGLSPAEQEAKWAAFEPGLRQTLRTMPAVLKAHKAWRRGHPSMAGWPAPTNMPAPSVQGEPVQIGVNDSLLEVEKQVIQEIATLGLGRTGDAPSVPVPGLGAQSAGAPAAKPPTSTPPPTTARNNVIGIGSDVAVVEGGKQYVGKVSRTLPDGRYEVSFAGDRPPVNRPYDKTEVSTTAATAAK